MVALCRSYRDNGYVDAEFEPGTFFSQGTDFAIADLSWSIRRTDGRAPWRFNTTYQLIRTVEGWRVLLCTAYSEQKLSVGLQG